jgi:mannitol-specific phosphotransferase system IIBC component
VAGATALSEQVANGSLSSQVAGVASTALNGNGSNTNSTSVVQQTAVAAGVGDVAVAGSAMNSVNSVSKIILTANKLSRRTARQRRPPSIVNSPAWHKCTRRSTRSPHLPSTRRSIVTAR